MKIKTIMKRDDLSNWLSCSTLVDPNVDSMVVDDLVLGGQTAAVLMQWHRKD